MNPVTSDLITVETTQDITLKPLTTNRQKPYSRCRGWIHSVNVSQNDLQMARPHSMRLIYLHTLKDYYINMSWMQIRNCDPHHTQRLEIYCISEST